MTTIRTVAVHEVVRAAYPRPEAPLPELGQVVGRVIDATVSQLSHEVRLRRKPTAGATARWAAERLAEGLRDADLAPDPAERDRLLAGIRGVLAAFRASELAGLPRPRSRLVRIGDDVGVYAQPDFWDGRARFFEMKTYRVEPIPPDVRFQVELFQLAFPGLAAWLIAFDRHASPVTTTRRQFPALSPERTADLLRYAHAVATRTGAEKVLEWVDVPVVNYPLPPSEPTDPGASAGTESTRREGGASP